jgi:plastocyanin
MKALGRCLAGVLMLPLPGLAATHVVTIEGLRFEPAALNVHRGDKVVWQNKDVVPHTATAAGKFDSRRIDSGASWSWTAGQPGFYDYVCTYHRGMKGSITVK